ncbi:hypothetical protein NE237_021556 [Protea cynaroides]|uniref:Bifunctional inhibitor/plant lipid transfer protein/seed storage helical domain-containing protein n=1 Tax=Protea cynaroides TaxID=273540 RepID=A0A9Q0HAH4_9MAGN|nr:hypothetical protein NE237_021556 [Protea cynaroides]
MKTKVPPYFVVVCVLVMLLLGGGPAPVVAVTCDGTELNVCKDALSTGVPSKICCDKLKEQESCLPIYFKDPKYQIIFQNPNTKKIATTLEVANTIPTHNKFVLVSFLLCQLQQTIGTGVTLQRRTVEHGSAAAAASPAFQTLERERNKRKEELQW